MFKLYIVVRVWLLVRKGLTLDAIRLVRAKLGDQRLVTGYHEDSLSGLVNAKKFVTDVRNGTWPETY